MASIAPETERIERELARRGLPRPEDYVDRVNFVPRSPTSPRFIPTAAFDSSSLDG